MKTTLGKSGALLGIAGVLALGAGTYLFFGGPRVGTHPAAPADGDAELGPSREAGKVDQLSGTALLRNSVPEDLAPPAGKAPASVAERPPSTEAKLGMPFYLGTYFSIKPKSYLQIQTQGNWIMGIEEEAEIVLDDARRDADGKHHTAAVYVRRGVFKAKPHDYDPTAHVLEIRNPIARIHVDNGEIGMRVNEAGRGQVWLVSGKATVTWNDGRKKELHRSQMDYL